jgi:hypothetical protein
MSDFFFHYYIIIIIHNIAMMPTRVAIYARVRCICMYARTGFCLMSVIVPNLCVGIDYCSGKNHIFTRWFLLAHRLKSTVAQLPQQPPAGTNHSNCTHRHKNIKTRDARCDSARTLLRYQPFALKQLARDIINTTMESGKIFLFFVVMPMCMLIQTIISVRMPT